MIKKTFLLTLFVLFNLTNLQAQNSSKEEQKLTAKHLQEQMQREKKFAQEQKFYQGKDYNLSAEKVDPKDLDSVPTIEPENDFDMTDVYRDDI